MDHPDRYPPSVYVWSDFWVLTIDIALTPLFLFCHISRGGTVCKPLSFFWVNRFRRHHLKIMFFQQELIAPTIYSLQLRSNSPQKGPGSKPRTLVLGLRDTHTWTIKVSHEKSPSVAGSSGHGVYGPTDPSTCHGSCKRRKQPVLVWEKTYLAYLKMPRAGHVVAP